MSETGVGANSATSEPHRRTILVCDDEKIVGQLVVHVLRDEGYAVLEAATAAEALDLAAQERGQIDLLLTDLSMAGMQGYELADKLVGQRPALAVMIMSGHVDEHQASEAAPGRKIAFLEKPFTLLSLLSGVRALLAAPEP